MGRQTLHPASALALLALVGAAASACVRAGDANAERAYYELEENALDRATLARTLATVERAREANPRDPWVYTAQSLAVLAAGDQIGDRYVLKSYEPEAVDRALGLAVRAVELDQSASMMRAHLARIQIIKGEYETAFETLTAAHDLDPDSFYPWYMLGIVAEKRHNRAEAELYFLEAELRASRPSHARYLNTRRQNLARMAMPRSGTSPESRENQYVGRNFCRYRAMIENWSVKMSPPIATSSTPEATSMA